MLKNFKSNTNNWYSVTEFIDDFSDFKFFCEIQNDSLIKDDEKDIIYGVLDGFLDSVNDKYYLVCVKVYNKSDNTVLNDLLIEEKECDRFKFVPRSFIISKQKQYKIEG